MMPGKDGDGAGTGTWMAPGKKCVWRRARNGYSASLRTSMVPGEEQGWMAPGKEPGWGLVRNGDGAGQGTGMAQGEEWGCCRARNRYGAG